MLPTKGDIIELIHMDDPYAIEPGEQGEVLAVVPCGNNEIQIQVSWNNGRNLHLIHPIDKFKIIKKSDS